MTRPVRPVALVILTACMIYPGVTLLWQGFYPLIAGEYFSLLGDQGAWITFLGKFGVHPLTVSLIKGGLGLAWVAGVLGLWAGDGKAYPVVLGAAALSLLHPGGSMVMAVVALVCLLFFREKAEEVPA